MITFDEGGGYYDSGYVQRSTSSVTAPGNPAAGGVEVPSRGGRVVHTYYDHVSFDKFVGSKLDLHETLSPLGRDNLPNPVATRSNPYVPLNQPAIGDLFDMFDFGEHWTLVVLLG